MTRFSWIAVTTWLLFAFAVEPSLAGEVKLLRVPDGGIQPQCAVDGKGVLHLLYFKGDPARGDVFYVRSTDSGEHFSRPLRVNSVPGSVIAVGNVRGAHLALGKNGRVHVAWMGSDKATPRGPDKESPLLYTRLSDDGTAFERQQNVIQSAYGLDGGASIAADAEGHVYVVWHASPPGKRGEQNRCVWVAESADDGKTFAPEKRAIPDETGACGCCGMRAFADSKGRVYMLYRAAKEGIHRDIYLLESEPRADTFRGLKLHEWNIDTCPMSTAAFAEAGDTVLAAWETEEQVYGARIDRRTGKPSDPLAAPGQAKPKKHPAVAGNRRGETILIWTEGMGWNKGGSLAWQVFDAEGKPTTAKGRAPGVPTWSLVAVFTRPDGGFTILY